MIWFCPGSFFRNYPVASAPQNIREGAWVLLANYIHFPPKSIFLAVVDPGVGTRRKALAVRTGEAVFIDRFGQIVTNIPPIPNRKSYRVSFAREGKSYFQAELPHYPVYADAPEGMLFLITGSSDTLEVSVRDRSAASLIKAKLGDRVVMD